MTKDKIFIDNMILYHKKDVKMETCKHDLQEYWDRINMEIVQVCKKCKTLSIRLNAM